MKCSVCNQDHSRQRLLYPVGSTVTVKNDFLGGVDLSKYDPMKPYKEAERVKIPAYSLGWVIGHCDDGRAKIEFKAEEESNDSFHTFHFPDNYFTVEGVTQPSNNGNLIWFGGNNDFAKIDTSGSITICIDGEPATLTPKQWHGIAKDWAGVRDFEGGL